jgi:F420-0:gamma-glutamyl ligase
MPDALNDFGHPAGRGHSTATRSSRMKVNAVHTRKVTPGCCTLFELLDESLPQLPERSIVAITSKVVSLCEGRAVPVAETDRDALVEQEAQYFLPPRLSKYHYCFTITRHTLVESAGIDQSNGGGYYVLWPRDPQATANAARRHLATPAGRAVGVIIIDSVSRPFRLGTNSIAIGFSGFAPLHNYAGEPDLFGRRFRVQRSDLVDGLATAAGVVMGEGSEQTPLAIIEDVPFVRFRHTDPTDEELATLRISVADDLYAPFWKSVHWRPGGQAG